MTGIRSLRCRAARRRLTAAHDGELPIAHQVALDAHLDACADCRRFRQELADLGAALREHAAEHRPDETDCAGAAARVLAALPAGPRRPLRRLRELAADRQRLCVVGGAGASMLVAGVFVAMALSFSPPVHPHSLSGFLQGSNSLGSNANPLQGFESGVSLPHVSADTQAAAMLIRPLPPLVLENLALTAVVTREGQLASVEVLGPPPPDARPDDAPGEDAAGASAGASGGGAPDAELQRALSRLASGVRFVPARAWGAPVAVNVVWLLERTTVLARSPSTQNQSATPGAPGPADLLTGRHA